MSAEGKDHVSAEEINDRVDLVNKAFRAAKIAGTRVPAEPLTDFALLAMALRSMILRAEMPRSEVERMVKSVLDEVTPGESTDAAVTRPPLSLRAVKRGTTLH